MLFGYVLKPPRNGQGSHAVRRMTDSFGETSIDP